MSLRHSTWKDRFEPCPTPRRALEHDAPPDSCSPFLHQSHADVVLTNFIFGIEAGTVVNHDDVEEPVTIPDLNRDCTALSVLHRVYEALLQNLESGKSDGDRWFVPNITFDHNLRCPHRRHLIGELRDRLEEPSFFDRRPAQVDERGPEVFDRTLDRIPCAMDGLFRKVLPPSAQELLCVPYPIRGRSKQLETGVMNVLSDPLTFILTLLEDSLGG